MQFDVTLNNIAGVFLQNTVRINVEQEDRTRHKKQRQTRGINSTKMKQIKQ